MGLVLGRTTLITTVALHFATFATVVPFLWLVPDIVLAAPVFACGRLVVGRRSLMRTWPRRRMNVLLGLFVYAALTFWYFYQTFGVHKVHSPEAGSLWLRVISAWLTLMLVMMEGDLQLADPTHEPDPPPAPW